MRRQQRRRGHPLKRIFLMSVVVGGCGIALGALALVGWVVGVAESAPNIDQLKPLNPGGSTQLFAADGSSLGFIQSTVLRTVVHDQHIPRRLKEATVAIEDRRFYQHGGVDYQGIIRAAIKDIFGGGKDIQGGSTLTMQLVRNLYEPRSLATQKTIKRKIIEAKLAQQLEKEHSKNWILDSYLNDVDYGTEGGQSAIGVGAASQMFFNKPVWKISLAQAALLAGLPQAPSEYNPFQDPSLAEGRRHDVLAAMVSAGDISQSQADAADSEPLGVKHNSFYETRKQPYFFDYVIQSLRNQLCPKTPTDCPAVDNGGLKVYTTLDLKRQAYAQAAIAKNEGQPGDPAASLVTIDPSDGHIVAMANSSSYAQNTVNYAANGNRQTGSAFKPFVLMTAIHDFDANPDSTYYDSHELFPGWLPSYPSYHVQTAEHSYLGTISLSKALILSDNTVYAQLDVDVTPVKVTAMAHAMGITSPLDSLPAEGIGGLRVGVSALQMSDAYATIANGGYHITPTAITKVAFPDGAVKNLGDPPRTQVFTDGEAAAAIEPMKGVITSGTGTAAGFGCPAAGKTGTTSSYTDAWFVGFTPTLSTAVWVGYPNTTTSMNDVNGLGPGFGGTLAAPIWHDYMVDAAEGSCGDFPAPTTPFSGTPYFGKHSAGGGGYSYGYGNSNSYTSTTPYSNTYPTSTSGGATVPPTTTATGTDTGAAGNGTTTPATTGSPTGTVKPPTGNRTTGPPPGYGTGQTGGAGTAPTH
jgi:penicillin-binding protein 1A